MTVRRCIPWPDRRLRRAAAPVETVTDAVRDHWQHMIDTMGAMRGVGLAAPQIGVMLRLTVVDASESRGQAVRVANPVVLHASTRCASTREQARTCPASRRACNAPAR